MSTSPTDTAPSPEASTKLTSTWAVLGLVFGFLFWPLGVLFSILGLRETGKRGPRAGRGLAIAGLIVSVLAAITTVIIIVFLSLATGSAVKAVNDATASASSSASSAAPSAAAPSGAEADVVIDSCKDSDFGAEAQLTITNSTDSAQSYLVSISGNDAGGQRVSELSAASNSIAAGQSAKVQAIGTLADGTTISGCTIANVTRL